MVKLLPTWQRGNQQITNTYFTAQQQLMVSSAQLEER